jgi:hypothetical protein
MVSQPIGLDEPTFISRSSLVARLMEMHGESYTSVTVDDKGQRVERVDGYEPPVQSSV